MGVIAILLIIAMLATFGVMATGIFLMAKGGEANTKYGNSLMQWRVILQAVSLVLLAVLIASK
jgi:Hypoxia induced protein conserved region